jgi:sensor histidine kinase YesM
VKTDHRENKIIEIKFDNDIDPSKIEIPPMLIQPFIENAFVHAFNSKSINPELIIDFSREPDYLLCTITENGWMLKKLKNYINLKALNW